MIPIPVTEHDVLVPSPLWTKKQVWDGEKFVPMLLCRINQLPTKEQIAWLSDNYGPRGTYLSGKFWNYSEVNHYMVVDEKIFTWFQLRWPKK